MVRIIDKVFPWLVGLTAVAFAVMIYLIFFYAPVELTMGVVQKIFYSHVPAAMVMYAGFTLTAVGSLLYLLKRNKALDAVALSGVEVGLFFAVYVLVSGPLWAIKAWGKAWVWEPQLTATFVLFLLFAGYALLRWFSSDNEQIRKIAAVLAVIGFVDIPIVHYAVRKWGGLHPVVERQGGGGLADAMKLTLTVSMVAFLLLFLVLLWMRIRVRLTEMRLDEVYLDVEDVAHEMS
ncbi:MAG: cytochrome c biogenesis protein [Myxococcota bacterium]